MDLQPHRLTLRAATANDAAEVADVILQSRGRFLRYAPMAHSPPEVRAWVRDGLIPSDGVVVACGVAGEVVGVLATSRADGVAWIDQLYVMPSHVGRGIGSSLMRQALQTCGRPVRLHTFQANIGARRFYERHGFIARSFTDGSENEERCPAVLMELPEDT
ncbi:MAG: N-acetyltransferase family protein [Rhizobacter sp.]